MQERLQAMAQTLERQTTAIRQALERNMQERAQLTEQLYRFLGAQDLLASLIVQHVDEVDVEGVEGA